MKIVQSLWSKPSMYNGIGEFDRFSGGWPSEKHHAISWSYSFGLLKRYHPDLPLELYSDDHGANWLVNQLGLKYDKVDTSLNNISHYNPIFWALGKIYTYSKQEEPFIHVDGDVYTWQRLDTYINKGKLIAQSFEINHKINKELLANARKTGYSLPGFLEYLKPGDDVVTVNAGVLGGVDLDFFNKYTQFAFRFIAENQELIEKQASTGSINILFEQIFFAQLALAQYGSLDIIDTIVSPETGQIGGLTCFGKVPGLVKYIHLIGMVKSMASMVNHMEQRFAFEFPETYARIQEIYPQPPLHYLLNGNHNSVEHSPLGETGFTNSLAELVQLQPGKSGASPDDIEDVLTEYFDLPEYNMLWDLFQLETAIAQTSSPIHHNIELTGYWKYLYHYTPQEFMNVPLCINDRLCRIVYLYYNWDGILTDQNIAGWREKKGKGNAEENTLSAYIFSRHFNNTEIIKPEAWFCILLMLEEECLTGKQLFERICASSKVQAELSSLYEDLYFFIASQVFLYFRIKPAPARPGGLN